jgi:hypothetical protein
MALGSRWVAREVPTDRHGGCRRSPPSDPRTDVMMLFIGACSERPLFLSRRPRLNGVVKSVPKGCLPVFLFEEKNATE